MYNCSSAFHEAVKSNAHQECLLIFNDLVLSNEDIDIEAGVRFMDVFNHESGLSIGQTPSNELKFTIFNDNGYLDDYEFGECKATIGVLVDEEEYYIPGAVHAESAMNEYDGYTASPYLTRNGTAVSSQPNGAVRCLIIYDGILYAFTDNGYKAYRDSDGAVVSITQNNFMKNKAKNGWRGLGICMSGNAAEVFEKTGADGVKRTYEFVPLGYFSADRPNVADDVALDFTCNDRMQKFEKDMPTDAALGITYPVTHEGLLEAICEYADVPCGATGFINSTATISRRPEDFNHATMRTVVGWIAEAAASNAKFDRDGILRMYWLAATGQVYDENDYSEFHPYWYETPQIGKLYNRTTSNGTESTIGSGENGYLIQDNPLLKGVS